MSGVGPGSGAGGIWAEEEEGVHVRVKIAVWDAEEKKKGERTREKTERPERCGPPKQSLYTEESLAHPILDIMGGEGG